MNIVFLIKRISPSTPHRRDEHTSQLNKNHHLNQHIPNETNQQRKKTYHILEPREKKSHLQDIVINSLTIDFSNPAHTSTRFTTRYQHLHLPHTSRHYPIHPQRGSRCEKKKTRNIKNAINMTITWPDLMYLHACLLCYSLVSSTSISRSSLAVPFQYTSICIWTSGLNKKGRKIQDHHQLRKDITHDLNFIVTKSKKEKTSRSHPSLVVLPGLFFSQAFGSRNSRVCHCVWLPIDQTHFSEWTK